MSQIKATLSKEESGLTPTLNNMGYMFDDITEIGENFVRFSETCERPVLDIGAAYGVASLSALERGAKVIANDLDARHLEILKSLTPEHLLPNLKIIPGRFPNAMNFNPETFDAILMSNFIHFLPEDEIVYGATLVHNWLAKDGKVFVLVGTPFVKMATKFLPVYEQRLVEGHSWPAFVEDTSKYLGERAKAIQPFMNYFDLESLKRVFKDVGFTIEWADYIARPEWPDDMRLDGREQVGLIGIKEV